MANSSLKQILNEARDSGALEIEGAKLDFAIALARLLEVSKMSRSELAKALQVSLPMVTKILRGDTNLTIETMVRAVRAAKGEPVAWRGINDLGEVVTDWIDAPHSARSSTRGNDVAIDKDKVFELFGRYWEIAYNEGRTGEGFPDLANDVLAELRDALDADDGEVFTAMLVNIDGHDYGLRPGAARIVREALRKWGMIPLLLNALQVARDNIDPDLEPDDIALIDAAIDAAKDGAW